MTVAADALDASADRASTVGVLGRQGWPIADDWPDIPARDGVVRDILGYLSEGVSVNLVGLRGSGRTHILKSVVKELRAEHVTVPEVSGVLALRDRPLAALAVAGVSVPSAGSAASVSTAVSGLLRLMSGRTPVLVIDDADDLDQTSAGVVVAARIQQPFPILSVTRASNRRTAVTRTLTAELQPSVRVAVEPLPFEELHGLICSLLPGTVDPTTVARIATESGGLPGLVRAIVDSGMRTGTLVRQRGSWTAPGTLWNGQLCYVVESLLTDLTDDEIEDLTRLALAGTAPLDDYPSVVDPGALARLGEAGLVRAVDLPAGAFIGVFPPLLTKYLHHEDALAWRAGVDPTSPRGGAVEREFLSPVAAEAAQAASGAAMLSSRFTEYWRAEMANLRREWRQDRRPETALPLLLAMDAALVTPEEVAEVLRDTPSERGGSEAAVEMEGWAALRRGVDGADVPGARQALRESDVRCPEGELNFRAVEARLDLLYGTVPDPSLLDSALEDEHRLGREAAGIVAIESLLAAGRVQDALEAIDALSPSRDLFTGHAEACRAMALVLSGDALEGMEWALAEMAKAQAAFLPGQIHAHAYVAAVGMTLCGHLRAVDRLVEAVLPLAESSTFERHYQVGFLSVAAVVVGWAGRWDYARNLAQQAATLDGGAGPLPAMMGDSALSLSPSACPDPLWGYVQDRLAGGFVTAAVFAAVPAMERAPDEALGARVAEAGLASQSPVLRALARYLAALGSGDPEAVEACADELRGVCGPVYAMRAGIACASMLRARGEPGEACARVEAAWHEGGDLGRWAGGLFTRFVSSLGLTDREQKAAEFIHAGLSTHRAAALLGVSTRTVENHLFSAYRKIGVENRQGLRAAMSTWLDLSR